ncbi:MAG: dephospho-CoA kinase [Lachnospiraceae bacterium]|nr:dephospho-CoA kinase [Lachnospiraceae bacterium]
MRIIGITGGIGTGKSTILHLLEEKYQAYIVETDKLAHELMKPGCFAYNKIVEHFGMKILLEDKNIDRTKLGGIVFHDERERIALNDIVHPVVKQYIIADIENKRREGFVKIYVIEAALLIEDGYKDICDELWYIHVEKEERIKRLLAGRGESRKKWEAVIESQSSEEFYKKNCEKIVDNSKNLEKTADIVNDLLYKTI